MSIGQSNLSKLVMALSLIFLVGAAWACSFETATTINNLLWLAVLLLFAKISGLIERLGQTAVLGELLIGVILGNLYLLGIDIIEPVKSNNIIAYLAQLGVVILLFQIGLETSITSVRQDGIRVFLVACVGVAGPCAPSNSGYYAETANRPLP